MSQRWLWMGRWHECPGSTSQRSRFRTRSDCISTRAAPCPTLRWPSRLLAQTSSPQALRACKYRPWGSTSGMCSTCSALIREIPARRAPTAPPQSRQLAPGALQSSHQGLLSSAGAMLHSHPSPTLRPCFWPGQATLVWSRRRLALFQRRGVLCTWPRYLRVSRPASVFRCTRRPAVSASPPWSTRSG